MMYSRANLVLSIAASAVAMFVTIAHATPPPAQDPSPTPHDASPDQHSAPSTQDSPPDERDDPRYGLLSPLPSTGGIPLIYDRLYGPSAQELAQRAKLRDYEKQLRLLKRKYFQTDNPRAAAQMREGLEQLQEFTDPAAFAPMLEVFADSPDGVRLAIYDFLREQGEAGQAALAWDVIHMDKSEAAMRNEATLRLSEDLKGKPTPQPVLQVLDTALRSNKHEIANNAGALAGAISAIETIPLLIFGQSTSDPAPGAGETGDLAWIAIQTQQAYVANVQPVVGDDSGAFQPVIGVVTEGTVLRVMDAVVVVYRTEIHNSLVAMTTHDWGESTEYLNYDMRAWWNWYNSEYVPFKNEQLAEAKLADRNPPNGSGTVNP